MVTTHHERENSPPEVVVVNDNCGVNNAYLFGQKNSPAHFTTTNGITLDVRYDFVVIHSVKAADGDDMEDPELTLLAKGLEQQSSFRSYVVIIASLRSNKEFLTELQNNAYHGVHHEYVADHIAVVLEMLDLINIPGVDSHQLRIKVFPLLLANDARQWWINEGKEKSPLGKNSLRNFSVNSTPNHTMEKKKCWAKEITGGLIHLNSYHE
ncbi:hypothetical protein Tco_0976103 [Tanacetum coccineum]|uniref:Uncharacterized protein n=1 Tax=Tanacetum coccineum TaxID=301880 RepID=A0ABQ5EGF4_9ASTR